MPELLNSVSELLNSVSKENAHIFQAFFVVFLALFVDLIQKRVFKGLSLKAEKNQIKWDDALLRSIPRPLSVIIWVSSIAFSAEIFQKETGAVIFGAFQPLRDAAVIASLAWFLVLFIKRIEDNYINSEGNYDRTTVFAVSKLARVSAGITAVLMILQTLGWSVSGVLAFGGVGGIAVGFAAKDLLSNFFGGLFIYLDRPFAAGDWIRSPDREVEGIVENIGWRVTRIRTFEKRPLYIPNAVFSQIAVENPSRMSNRRIKETIGIRYDDVSKMETITNQVKKMLKNHAAIDTNRTLIVNFNCFAPSSLDFFIYTFTKTTDWIKFHEIKQDVLLKTIGIIKKNGAEIAFPTSTLHISNQGQLNKPDSNS